MIKFSFVALPEVKSELQRMPNCENYFELHSIDSDGVAVFRQVYQAPVRPRTKTTYEKVEFKSDKEKALEFASSEFYYVSEIHPNQTYSKVTTLDALVSCGSNLYRKVEREVTWKDELNDFLEECRWLEDTSEIHEVIPKPDTENGEQFDNEFIKMCHLVASLTDKPE
jgi:hypothetical protein